MIDKNGYRLNIGIILMNDEKKLFWGKRCDCKNAWQFPQGGLKPYETLKEAMYRELMEEVGLSSNDVEIIMMNNRWVYYHLPKPKNHRPKQNEFVGQRQRWFLLKLTASEKNICLDRTGSPEFCDFQWVEYWYPMKNVVSFKRDVYSKVLREFSYAVSLQNAAIKS